MSVRRWVIAAVAGLALAGCGAPALDLPVTAAPSVVVTTKAPVTVGVPVSISIPSQGVTDEVVPVGLAPDGSMEVPDVHESGWWTLGPKPGERGAAVVIGHVDFAGVPGALGRIGQLHPGDLVIVKDASGVERTFATDSVTQIPKNQYAARTVPLVFGPVPDVELRIVTCSGTVVDHSYLDNTVLSAHLVTT